MRSTCVNKGDYLLVEVTGVYIFKEFIATIHDVAEHCRTDNLSKVLIDLRDIEGNPSIFDRFQIGLEVAKAWGTGIEAVAIGKPSFVSRVAENTAVNRGARLRVMGSMDEALKWLELKQEQKHA